MATEKCPYCGSIKKCHDVGKDGKHYHCGNCGKIWERKYKISTTITKAFFEMKMADLKETGHFIEFKEEKPFWNKRLHNINENHKALGTEIVFLVGKEPHRFKVVEIRLTHSDYVPLKYVSAISTKFAYAIKCVPLEVEA